jgi:hypothetical protein
MTESKNPFETAQAQFDQGADLLGLTQDAKDLMRWPLREFHFRIPVRMDDGTVKVFNGFRVQHNLSCFFSIVNNQDLDISCPNLIGNSFECRFRSWGNKVWLSLSHLLIFSW